MIDKDQESYLDELLKSMMEPAAPVNSAPDPAAAEKLNEDLPQVEEMPQAEDLPQVEDLPQAEFEDLDVQIEEITELDSETPSLGDNPVTDFPGVESPMEELPMEELPMEEHTMEEPLMEEPLMEETSMEQPLVKEQASSDGDMNGFGEDMDMAFLSQMLSGNLTPEDIENLPDSFAPMGMKEEPETLEQEPLIEPVFATPEPVIEESVAEEPAVEEPVAEMPVTEEPVAEEPAADPNHMMTPEEIAALIAGTASEEPAAEAPVIEEPVIEEPVAEMSVAEEPAADPNHMMTPEEIAALIAGTASEEPVAEMPVIEEPAVEEPAADPNHMMTPEEIAALIAGTASEEPAAEAPVAEMPAAEEPVAEMPAAEEPAAEEPAIEESSVGEFDNIDQSSIDDMLMAMSDQNPMDTENDANAMDLELMDNLVQDISELPKEETEGLPDISIDDMIKAIQGEMTGEEDIFGTDLNEIASSKEDEGPVEDLLANSENYGLSDADILALDDGLALEDNVDLDAPGMSEEDMARVEAMSADSESTEAGAGGEPREPEQMDLEPDENEKGKKKKKKFSLKNFFLKFSDDEEDEEKDVDMNDEMVRELYGDRDSLADADPNEEFAKGKKKKKEKKKKEPKPKKEKKPKKPKKPKKAKEPKPKDPDGQIKIPLGTIIVGLLIGVVIVVGCVVGTNILSYNTAISSAQKYYDMKMYAQAYDAIMGVTVSNEDQELHDKIVAVNYVNQGMDAYDTFMEAGLTNQAVDALVQAVGRKNRYQEFIDTRGDSGRVNAVYDMILRILSEYFGMDEKTALDLYQEKDYDIYAKAIAYYGEQYKQ